MNHRKTPLPEVLLSATTKGRPFSRARAVTLTRDGRRALNAFGPQLANELGSRHRRMILLGQAGPANKPWPEVDLLFCFGGERRAPRSRERGLVGTRENGLVYSFQRCHVRGC